METPKQSKPKPLTILKENVFCSQIEQEIKMWEKATTSCTIYPQDLARVKELKEELGCKNLADVIAHAMKFTESHDGWKS